MKNIKRLFYNFRSNYLGLSGYKLNFFRKKILRGMYKRQGFKGIYYFTKNFLNLTYTQYETADPLTMFIRLHIEPTINCNLNCKMCISPKSNQGLGNMSFDNFRTIVDKMHNAADIYFGGLGEPFVNPDIVKMFEYLKSKEIYFGLATNGILLTESVSNKLLESDIAWINISLDSLKKETFASIRNSYELDSLLENIKNFQRLKRKYKKDVLTEIVMVYMRENADEICDIIKFAAGLKYDAVRIKILEDWDPQYLYKKLDPIAKESCLKKNESLPKIREALNTAKSLGIRCAVTAQMDDSENRVVFENQEKKCESPWYHVSVLYNGDVVPCCGTKTPHRNCVFGNILGENFETIWNNRLYRDFRKKHLTGNLPSICDYCTKKIGVYKYNDKDRIA